jgi:hypothetical protein
MQTLIIGDLHFNDKPYGMLEAQKHAIEAIIRAEAQRCNKIIFLGDLMMHRNPRPQVLLALKEVLDYAASYYEEVHVLRGNHDSVNKSDDGVTALSLFDDSNVFIHNHWYKIWDWTFIPHYEDQEIIKTILSKVPEGNIVFGHFGFVGALNSAGDSDFDIRLEDFRNPTILGHIHNHIRRDNVQVLGTPYSTNFGEAGKDCYYGILSDKDLETIPIKHGPRHLVVDYENIEDNIDWINDPNYSTYLRININTVDKDQDDIAELRQKLKVAHVEIKFKPLFDNKEEFKIDATENLTLEIDDILIDKYINSSNTTINKENLLEGLTIINEHQQRRNP